jgi:hypothetical protein
MPVQSQIAKRFIRRRRAMRDDIAVRLRKALDGTIELPPSIRNLLHAAALEIERLRAKATGDKRGGKGSDDDGAAEVILAGPPKKPRGPLPSTAAAVKLDDGDAR